MFKKLAKKISHALEMEILDYIENESITLDNQEDWHHIIYNTEYRFIYENDAKDWFIEQDLDMIEVINSICNWQIENFGECDLFNNLRNSDIQLWNLGNLTFYIIGEIYLNELNGMEFILDELKKLEECGTK